MPDAKIGFSNLDNFLKIAPVIGMCVIVYLQSLFPSKAEFEKLTSAIYEVEKQIIRIQSLQNGVDQNTLAIQDIQRKLQELEIQIVRMHQNKINNGLDN